MKEKTLCKADGGQVGIDTHRTQEAETPVSSQGWFFFSFFFKSLKSLALVGLKKYRMVDRPTAVV